MIAFSYYLLKVFICSVILYGYYLVALRNKVFHYWNRFYLLGVIVVSLAVPLITIPMLHDTDTVPSTAIKILDVVSVSDRYVNELQTTRQEPLTFTDMLPAIYIAVSVILAFIFIRTLFRISRIIRNHEIIKLEDIFFLNTSEKGTPFSFLQYIFWNREIEPDSGTGKRILKHEIVHVRQKHSWDQLFLNTVLLVFWSNPVFWLIRKEIQMIHEFIADREAVAGQDTSAFAEMILGVAYPGNRFSITNHFFHSPIKRRLHMLLKSKNPKKTYLSRLFALFLLLTVGAAFSAKTGANNSAATTGSNQSPVIRVVIDAGHGGNDAGARTPDGTEEKQLTLELAKMIRDLNASREIEILLTREHDINQPIKEKVDKAISLNPDVFVSLHINHSPTSSKNGFELLIGNNQTSLEKENRILGSMISHELKKIYTTSGLIKQSERNKVYVLDAPQISYPTVLIECGYLSNEKDLAFLSSRANKEKVALALLNAIRNYIAEKNAHSSGKSDHIQNNPPGGQIVTLKASAIEYHSDPESQPDPMLIIDGKRTDPSLVNNKMIYADSLTVFPKNNTQAISAYGEEAKNGVMVFHQARITEKKVDSNHRDTLPKGVQSVDITENGDVIVIFKNGKAEKMTREEAHKQGYIPVAIQEKNSNKNDNQRNLVIRGPEKNPLIFIDGKRIGKKNPGEALENELQPEDIQSITVLKNEQAIKIYGEDGRDGVLLITTKKAASKANELLEVVVEGQPAIAKTSDVEAKGASEVRNIVLAEAKPEPVEVVVAGKPAEVRAAKAKRESNEVSAVSEGKLAEGKKINANAGAEEVVVAGEKIFSKTEIAPRFPGGFEAFTSWIQEKVKQKAGKNHKAYKGSCTIRFVVFKSGKTGAIKIINDHGNQALASLVAEVLAMSPDWEPAIQNGHKVSATQEFTLKFE